MATIDEDFDRIARRLPGRLDALAEEAVARILVELSDWTAEQPQLAEILRAGARESIGAELEALRDGATVPTALPQIDAEGARLSARSGLPLDRHLFLYRVGHAVQWAAWLDLVEGEQLEPPRRRMLLERGSQFFFAYADRLSRLVTEEHQRERERILRSHEQRRVHLVREVLDGADGDSAALDYPLEGRHVAFVLTGDGSAEVVRAVAAEQGRRLLLVELIQQRWWAWIGGRRPLPSGTTGIERVPVPEGAVIASGAEGEGVEGFRRSHRQAVIAHRIAAARGDAKVGFDAVALEALALEGGDRAAGAAAFVERELRGIDEDDPRSAGLRATLEAYFARNQNAAATAAALGVHDQTVAKRLAAVERRTGRGVAGRRAELELALRLRRCLGG